MPPVAVEECVAVQEATNQQPQTFGQQVPEPVAQEAQQGQAQEPLLLAQEEATKVREARPAHQQRLSELPALLPTYALRPVRPRAYQARCPQMVLTDAGAESSFQATGKRE